MEERKGYVTNIIYRNVENGYTVFELEQSDGEEETCVGTLPFINEGEYVQVTGEMVQHPVYMEQLKVRSFEVQAPDNETAMLRYLGSGAIAGVRGGLAKRIVDKFGGKTFEIIEQEPERLAEVKGISEKMARSIGEQFEEKREMRSATIFLQDYGISNQLAVKIYKTYGIDLYGVVKETPYKLAEDIQGIGFKIADDIAKKAGFALNDPNRIRAGILYVLGLGTNEGYVYMPEPMLLKEAVYRLEVTAEQVMTVLEEMEIQRVVIVSEERNVYLPTLYYAELNCARMLWDLNIPLERDEEYAMKQIASLEAQEELELDDQQRIAVKEAMHSGLLVVTGGPGTGKTTTINMIIRCFEKQGMSIMLAAPTGRAAKRMTEATGCEAQTIHRMLEYNGAPGEQEENVDRGTEQFGRNEWNPLETDVIIIDEMSMVDIHLMHSLLLAVVAGTRLILVGDENQLPSVGPGNVLRDIIRSRCFPVVELTKIFRQASESDIVVNAHKINKGEQVQINNKSRDFFFLKRYDADIIIRVVIALIQEKLPRYVDAKPFEIQVLTPMRKGLLGVERLNQILQRYLNPPEDGKAERAVGDRLFRTGDKVMQIRNNYQMEWEIRGRYGVVIEKGVGVFNGDTGILREINEFAETAEVEFEDGRFAMYSFKQLEELELAYAITIHKSQGSEYPAVILPLLSGPQMLLNRNLLYTAVTRARKCVTVVGNEETFAEMIRNEKQQKRYSALDERIRELSETTGDNNTDGEE